MKDFQQRVVEEKKELDSKLSNLKTFMSSKDYESLPLKHKQLLIRQRVLMDEYSDILKNRIELFKKET